MKLNYNLSDKQQNVVDALEELGWTIVGIKWTIESGIGPNCTLYYKLAKSSPRESIDITDYETW